MKTSFSLEKLLLAKTFWQTLVAPVQRVAAITNKNHRLVVLIPLALGFLSPDGNNISAMAIRINPIILKVVTFSPKKIIEYMIGKVTPKFTMVVLKETAPVLNAKT